MNQATSGITIAVIGAGSSYTPLVIKEFAQRLQRLPVKTVRLFDINASRLHTVVDFCQRMLQAEGTRLPLTMATDLAEAVTDADFVLTQFRVGGLEARHRDITLGLKYDLIGQETTGVGGFAKALRTIPEIMDICRAMKEHATESAWLLNFTNPSAIVTEAALKYGGVNCVGLCNGPYNLRRGLAKSLDTDQSRVELDYAGTNHFAWVRRVRVDGHDVTEQARNVHAQKAPANIPDFKPDPVFERLVGLPYNGYLRYYYYTKAMLEKLKAAKQTRAQEAMLIEKELFESYANPHVSSVPEVLSKRGGASYNLVAVDLVEAIAHDLSNRQIVNVQNNGAIDGIAADSVVEVSCTVSRQGAVPEPFGVLETPYMAMLQVVKAYETLTVEAGVHGNLEAALHALVVHPLGPTVDQAPSLLKELIEINRAYLPQFDEAQIERFFQR